MNDFFTPEENADQKVSLEEQQIERDKITAEVFEGKPAEFKAEEVVAESELETAIKEDDIPLDDIPLDDVSSNVSVDPPPLSPEMQAIVDSVNSLTSSISGMESRIKQTERRVGGISNEFYAAKDAAKEAATTQAKAPTPEAMAEAAKNSEAWEDLKKDFPSWATAIDSKINAQTSKFVSVDDFEALRASVSKSPTVDTSQLETRLVGLIHPDWKQITQDPNYATWLNAQSKSIQHLAYKGTTAEDAIEVFNKFKAREISSSASVSDLSANSEVKQIKADRKKRLDASTTTSTNHKTIKQKTEVDLTESELRASIANKVFAKN